ncbi:MAG: gliding motility-associated C-terminal domain-containing protein [Saprospiraceae bacterium]|nr:gliding motility-associated C-terminal domain-containing protein [Saprospiraceae bacterium]
MIFNILCRPKLVLYTLVLITLFSSLASSQKCVQFDIIGGNAPKGDCIWVPVKVYKFDTVLSVQFALAYDPLVITPMDKWTNPTLVGLDQTNINFDSLRKIVRFLWANPNGNCAGLKDGDTLLMIKFKLIGEPGTCTPVTFFNRSPIVNEILDCNADEYCFEEINPGDNQICIGQPTDLCVITYTCGTFTNTGSITIKPFGGMPPYTVDKLSLPPTQTGILANSGDLVVYNNLFPGNYQIRVTDANLKDTLINITVGLASPIAVFPNGIKNPTCANTSDGSINIRITGGSGSYTIGWRPINSYGVTNITKLPVGTYTVTVRDTLGCQATDSFTLFADTLFSQVVIDKDASCINDGKATARAWGGNPCPITGYCFFWSQNSIRNNCDTVSMNDSLSGNQFVIIEDCRGCRDTQFFEVKFSGNILDSLVIDSINCFGDSGVIHSFISSKGILNLPCSFRLTNQNNMPIFGGQNGVDTYRSPKLRPGTYYLEITDNGGCKRLDTIVLTEPTRLEIIENNIDTTESCQPGKDAFIDVRGFGGTPSYKFNWSTTDTTSRISGLSQGSYTLTLSDSKGCLITKTYTITQPNGPRIDSFKIINPGACPGDSTGSIEVVFTSGSAPINQFKWNVPGSTAILNKLSTGWYIVTITDANGCSAIDSVELKAAGNVFRISSFNIRNPQCYRAADGFIIINVMGNQSAPIYSWDNNVQNSVNTNLIAGTYCVTITDMGGCPPIDTCFVLTEPPKIGITLSQVTAPTCSTPGTCDGSAIVSLNCQDTINSITWSSNEQVFTRIDTAFQLCAGPQYVIATCGFCADTLLFNVPNAVPITIDTPSLVLTAPRCYNSNDGQITIKAKGGTGPYQYCWINPMINAPTISNLGDGMYHINIKDQFNCIYIDSIRLRQPDSIRVDIILGSTLDITCSGKNDGRITTAWTGGNSGKGIFNWIPNINQDSVATNLPSGNYILQVTDVKGCTGSASYTIKEPSPITYTLTAIDTPKCANDQILFSVLQASGGSGPNYRFTINNSAPNALAELVPLFSGNYSIRIYDKNNCFIDTNIIVTNPNNFLSLDFGFDTDSIQLGDSLFLDGKLSSSAIIDSIIWTPISTVRNPQSTSSYVVPNRNTVYILTVIDENGCEATDKVTIIVRNTRKFYAPNVFSPNGDNINDFFTLSFGAGVKAIRSLQIFDRWGNKVYLLENPDVSAGSINTWNGRFGNTGDLMNPGVFVYIIDVVFQDGNSIIYRGDINILR